MAKAGDAQAARLLLDRCLPPLRPVDAPVLFALPAEGGLSEQGQAVLAAVLLGNCRPIRR